MHSNHSRETISKSMPRVFHTMLEETVDLDVAEVAGRGDGDGNTTPSEEPSAPKIAEPYTKVEQSNTPSYRISCERHPYTFAHAMFGVSDGESDDDGQDDEPPKPRSTPKRAELCDTSRPPMTRPQKNKQ